MAKQPGELMATISPNGTRIVDRGSLTFLLEAQEGYWQICACIGPDHPDIAAICATWPKEVKTT